MNRGATFHVPRKDHDSTTKWRRLPVLYSVKYPLRIDRNTNFYSGKSIKWYFVLTAIIASFRSVIILMDYHLFDLETDFAIFQEEVPVPVPLFGPEGWSDVKLLIYMTTHLSSIHISFLPCWKDAIERLDIFKYADLMLYTSSDPTIEQLELLPFRRTTIKRYTNPGYQEGAVQAFIDPFLDNRSWFEDYDWVIRVNPDVLIRRDDWLMEKMLNTSVDMIVHECYSANKYTSNVFLHSDFFAFRPKAVDRERILQTERGNAEGHLSIALRPIFDEGRFAYVEGGKNAIEGYCRIEGVHSPVLHVHELANFCPYYYNVTKEGFYR